MTSKFILLVEDNPDDRLLAVRALQRNNIWNDIEIAGDGVAALDFLYGTGSYCGRDVTRLPALVLLDLKLPRLGGLDVLRRIREESTTKDLPVIMVTASWDPDDILRGYGLRADGYVSKAVGFHKLALALGQLGLDVLLNEEQPSPPRRPATAWSTGTIAPLRRW